MALDVYKRQALVFAAVVRDEILGLDVLDELVEFLELDLLILPRREGCLLYTSRCV